MGYSGNGSDVEPESHRPKGSTSLSCQCISHYMRARVITNLFSYLECLLSDLKIEEVHQEQAIL